MMSRRTLLAGSASLTLGALLGCARVAQEPTTSTSASAPESSAAPSPSASPSASAASSAPTPTPSPTGNPRPEVAGVIADDLDVPWGMIFLASGDALVSERNTGRILRVTSTGKVTTLGEVSGVQAPSGLGEGGLLGLALDPDDAETLYA